MSLKIIKNILANSDCYKSARKISPIGIQIHTIGTAQNTAQALADYWNQPGIAACVHYAVDAEIEGKVLQLLPEDYRSWADAGFGNGNLITIEGMESDYMRYTGGASYLITNEARFKADIRRSYNGLVLLCAKLCRDRGWNPQTKLSNGLYLISSHDEGRRKGLSSAHVDPTHVWDRMGYSMDGFRSAVSAAMNGEIPSEPDTPVQIYRVRRAWDDPRSQLGAYEILDNAVRNCPPGYFVFDRDGQIVYKGEETAPPSSEQVFVNDIGELASADMKESGILASVTCAQAILESGYGATELARKANNFFGMKASLSGNTWDSVWDGKSTYEIRTQEQKPDGTLYYITAEFRRYPDISTSLNDHSRYLLQARNGDKLRYQGIQGEQDYRKAAVILKDGGYATDINYVDKLSSLIERWTLTQFDGDGSEISQPPVEPPAETDAHYYRVRKTWTDAATQKGAFTDLDNAKRYADINPGYSVYDPAGKKVYSGSRGDYTVKVTAGVLNIRAGAGLGNQVNATISDQGVYTITDTRPADGYTWGKLKSGAGWIALEYTTKR